MQNPFDQFDEAEQNPFDQFDLVDEGGPEANYGSMTPREVVDALPGFLTRTPFEKQNDHLRNRIARDAELAELGLTGDRTESAAIGAYDGLSLGNYATERSSKALYPSYASMPFGAQVAGALDKQGILPEWAGGGQAKAQEDALRLFQKRQTEARAENPWSYMGGEIGGYLAPGGGVLSTGSKVAKGIGHATLKKELAMKGSGPIARGTRYLQSSVAPAAIAGGVDYGVYEATVGESARAAEEGRTASLGDRVDAFGDGVTSPEGYLFGAAASPIYRTGRGVASVATGGRISMTPLPQKQWAANLGQGNTPQARAYRMVAKRLKQDGVSTDQLRKAISNYHYAGYSTVDEMLFELAEASTQDKGGGKLKQLAVALGSVGGDAQQTARANFNTRKAEMPTRFREELRRAVGLEGSDFYQYGQQIENLQRTLPKPLYDSAYAKSISDKQWQGEVWPGLQTKPASQQAIVEAYDYARNVGELEVAGEIAELLPGIGRALDERTGQVVRAGAEQSAAARRNLPAKPSTQALDYIDRMLGDTAESLRSSATRRTELAKGPAGAQASLRSVVDDATGLNEGRDKAAELFAARDALDFGVKGFERGIDLETLQNEFARKSGRYGGEHIDPALLMGWIKGAENAIDKATNPGTVMRQIYGSERQRAKLLSMLPDGAELGPGGKGDKTKRRRVLVGGKRSDGSVVDGRFDRAGRMLASENEIVGNSQTGQRNEAIAEQGGLQRLANTVADAVLDPRQTINKGLRAGINRATRPGIFNEKVNRELGEIMFTGGRDNLNRIVDELDNLQRKPPAKLPMKGSGGGAGAVAANMPAKKAASNGLPMLNNTPAMMGAGAASGAVVDYDGDGEITERDIAIGAAMGALPKAARMADDVITSPSVRRVLEGSSEAGFTNPGKTGETIYAKSGRKYSMAEGSTMSKVIELARQGKTNTQIDEALGLSPGVAAHYRNVAKTGKPPVDMSPQSDSPVLTAGIDGRRRKDMLKDVMPKSQGARVPGTSKPLPMKGKDAPAAPAYRDDLTTAAVVGLPVGGAAGMYAYSMYKAEMYKRGQKDIPSFQEFMRMIEEEQRSRMGVPPRPGLKPQDLPQRVQG